MITTRPEKEHRAPGTGAERATEVSPQERDSATTAQEAAGRLPL